MNESGRIRMRTVLIGFFVVFVLYQGLVWALTSVYNEEGAQREEEIAITERPGWSVYRDSDGRFAFQYPDGFTLNQGTHPDYPIGSFLVADDGVALTEPVAVSVALPRDAYPGTNFVGAWVAVASDAEAITVESCETFEDFEEIVGTIESQQVNNTTWHRMVSGGGAAGTEFESRIYHTFHEDTCYEAALHIAIGTIGNYEPGTVREVNKDEVWQRLEEVFATFRIQD